MTDEISESNAAKNDYLRDYDREEDVKHLRACIRGLQAQEERLRAKLAEAEARGPFRCDDGTEFGLASHTGGAHESGLYGEVTCYLRHADGTEEHIRYVREAALIVSRLGADILRAERAAAIARASAAEAALPTVEVREALVYCVQATSDVDGDDADRASGVARDWLSRLPAPAAEAKAGQETPAAKPPHRPIPDLDDVAIESLRRRAVTPAAKPDRIVWTQEEQARQRAAAAEIVSQQSRMRGAAKPETTQAERDRRLGERVRASLPWHRTEPQDELIEAIAGNLKRCIDAPNIDRVLRAIAAALRAEREEAAK